MNHDVAQVLAFFEIAPDEEPEAARQEKDASQGQMGRAGVVLPLIGRFDEAGPVDHAGRKRRDIAGQRLPREVGHEIERGSRLLGAAFDRGHELADTARIILLGEARDLGLDRLADLRIEERVDVPIDPTQHHAGSDREDQQVSERQLEGRRPEQFTDDGHGSCNRPHGSYGAEARPNPCRSWIAAARYARR